MEVNIISEEVFNGLDNKPEKLDTIVIKTAGKDLKFESFLTGQAELKIGRFSFTEKVYVAPIEDEMLLGLDFMQKYG